ncbi:MAG TPA: RNA-binding cell elongation regulator Jag/EloR [Candidatus Dormibacteraeota bacterium]|nr:RNA-binding cell elongation regulator Jag/EloR [Candidatus Dormibacteraeota bacterium]
MQSIEAEGNTIDDAIARALQLLGAPRERVEIEILANATKGLFGFGGKRARVRARLRRSVAEIASEPPVAAPPARAAESRQAHPARPATRTPPRERRRPAPTASRPSDDTPPSPAVLERARVVLAEIVQRCGVEATVAASGARLVIDGDTSGVMIGRRGATLDALEYVVNRAVGHEDERAGHIEVDANDYRARRRAALEALARRMAERARSKGKPVALIPLSPRERRVVHLTLQGDPTLTTRSAGSGFYRRLVIVPTASRTQA